MNHKSESALQQQKPRAHMQSARCQPKDPPADFKLYSAQTRRAFLPASLTNLGPKVVQMCSSHDVVRKAFSTSLVLTCKSLRAAMVSAIQTGSWDTTLA